MLNAHSRIAIPEEMLYFRSTYAGVSVEDWRYPNLSEESYAEIVEDFVSRAGTLHPELDTASLTTTILEDSTRDLRHPFETVLSEWARYHGKVRWGEKTPGNLFYVDIILDMYPDARFVYMVRDPRAGVASMRHTNFFPQDVVFNALTRRKHANAGLAHFQSHVPECQWLTVRYEDLVQDPKPQLVRICELIGEAYEPAMLAYHKSASSFMKEEASQSFNAAATQPVNASKIDQWRDRLAPDEIAAVEAICQEEMRRHGYQPIRPVLPLLDKARLLSHMGIRILYWQIQVWRHHAIRHYTVKHEIFARTKRRLRLLRDQIAKRFFPLA